MAESTEVDKDGLLYKRVGSQQGKRKFGQKKWNLVYVTILGGSLHYYKDPEDQEPKGSLILKELKLTPGDKQGSNSKEFCFSLKSDKHDYLFACDEESEYKEWLALIEAAGKKSPMPPLQKEKRKTRAEKLAFKAKKNMLGKAANSAIGKKAIKSQTPEEVKNLIASIKLIIEKESKNAKKATEIEENVFKIGIKTYLLLDGGVIKFQDVIAADKPLRQALELLSKCFDHAKYARNPNMQALHTKFIEVNKLLSEAGMMLTKVLEQHIKPVNVNRIKDTIEYLGDADRLMRIFNDPALNDSLQDLISAGEHYTQFHFYSDDV